MIYNADLVDFRADKIKQEKLWCRYRFLPHLPERDREAAMVEAAEAGAAEMTEYMKEKYGSVRKAKKKLREEARKNGIEFDENSQVR